MKRISSYILLLLTVASGGGYFLYLTFSGHITPNPVSQTVIAAVRPYPSLTSPKEVVLSCNYQGADLEVRETLYGSLNDYYKKDPNKKSAYFHSQDADMVMAYEQDPTIRELTTKIQKVAIDRQLSDDQALDLSACFLQSIPYDNAKAALILGPDYYKLPVEQVIPRYPYETLYDGRGICTDKSFLGAAVFRELGYSTALLTFDSQKHMSIGVEVPSGYGDFGTKYGVMELTGTNFRVGDIPEISSSAGLAVGGIETVPNVTTDSNTPVVSGVELSALSGTTAISGGNLYSRIVARMATKQQISALQPILKTEQADYLSSKAALAAAEASLASAESSYKNNPSNATYKSYTSAYSAYSSVYNKAQRAVDDYNASVNKYNGLVAAYKQY